MTDTRSSSASEQAALSPEESCEFYRLVEEVGSGRMTLPDVMRLAARRGVAQGSQEPAAWVQNGYHLWLTPHGQPAQAAMMWKEKSGSYPTPLYASPPTALPLVPWELDCQRAVCAAPECECPALTSTESPPP